MRRDPRGRRADEGADKALGGVGGRADQKLPGSANEVVDDRGIRRGGPGPTVVHHRFRHRELTTVPARKAMASPAEGFSRVNFSVSLTQLEKMALHSPRSSPKSLRSR